jgi:hypothetical protein
LITIDDLLALVPDLEAKGDTATLARVKAWLDDHLIDQHERLSSKPGIEGNREFPDHTGAGIKQLQARDAFWNGCKRLAIAGANRSAKTTTTIGLCFCKHVRDRAKDGDIYWIVAQDLQLARMVPMKYIWDYLPKSYFGDRVYNETIGFGMNATLVIHLPDRTAVGGPPAGKCTIIFKNETQDMNTFESQAVHGVVWTEASKEAIYDALISRLVDRGGFLLIDYLPENAWCKYRLRLNPAFTWFQFGMVDNSHNLPAGAIQDAEAEMSHFQAKVRIYGEEASAFGAVYPAFDTEAHVCKPFAFDNWGQPLKDGEDGDVSALYRCYDYGFRNPSTCLWFRVLPMGYQFPEGVGSVWDGRELDREVILVYRQWYSAGVVPAQQAKIIKEMSKGEKYRIPMGCDRSIFDETQMLGQHKRPKSIAYILQQGGVKCKKGKKGKGADFQAQIAKVAHYFEQDKIIFFDTCQEAIREHSSWRYKENKSGDLGRDGMPIAPGNEPPEDKDDHSPDALRYGLSENLTYHRGSARISTSAI